MKKVLSVLFLSLVAIPLLTITRAAANNGDEGDRKEKQMTKFNEHLKFGERDHDYRGHTGHRFDASPTSPMHGDPVAPGGGQSAPLDGGLSLLLAAGIGLGVKKARDKRVALKQQARA
ncbi:MAG TPA: hypothetical protein VNU72_00815 [Puia sp.]|jgi:hypothetical protein|nr:hypothetical protein [Puia sp.]